MACARSSDTSLPPPLASSTPTGGTNEWLGPSLRPGERGWKPSDSAVSSGFGRRFVIGAVLLLDWDAIREIGLFDERFFLYCEETDWQRRAPDARLAFGGLCRGASAVHAAPARATDPARREALFHAAQETYIRKWFGARAGWRTAPPQRSGRRPRARSAGASAGRGGSARAHLRPRPAALRGAHGQLVASDASRRSRRDHRQLRGRRALRLQHRDGARRPRMGGRSRRRRLGQHVDRPRRPGAVAAGRDGGRGSPLAREAREAGHLPCPHDDCRGGGNRRSPASSGAGHQHAPLCRPSGLATRGMRARSPYLGRARAGDRRQRVCREEYRAPSGDRDPQRRSAVAVPLATVEPGRPDPWAARPGEGHAHRLACLAGIAALDGGLVDAHRRRRLTASVARGLGKAAGPERGGVRRMGFRCLERARACRGAARSRPSRAVRPRRPRGDGGRRPGRRLRRRRAHRDGRSA